MSVDTSHPIGFIPRHPAPSRYLRIRAHHKKDKEFDRVFLAQTLEGTGPLSKAERRASTSTSTNTQNGESTGRAIWTVEFSKDGKYLAAAGQDKKVRVWATITTSEEREEAVRTETEAPIEEQDTPRLKAPVFGPKPIQVFEGHTGSILDLSWSKVCISRVRSNGGRANRWAEQLYSFLFHGQNSPTVACKSTGMFMLLPTQ
jgi:WD40 repeat protein